MPRRLTPTITQVVPNSGATSGKTAVTVIGTGFALGTTATSFKFATTPAGTVNCTSITECSVVSPAHAKPGVVDVRATVAKVSSPKTVADQFTYH